MTLRWWLSSVNRHVQYSTAALCSSRSQCPDLTPNMSVEVTHMNKSANFLINIANDLDGQPMNLGPFTPLDVFALRTALAAVVLTFVLVLSSGLTGV